MDIITKLNSLQSEKSRNADLHYNELCEQLGMKFLGIGCTRIALVYQNKCYKFQYDSDLSDNAVEFERGLKLKKSKYAQYFALPIRKVNDLIMQVEFVNGERCDTLLPDNKAKHNELMRFAWEVRDEVKKDLGFRIGDIHDQNVLVTPANEIKIVDFAGWG